MIRLYFPALLSIFDYYTKPNGYDTISFLEFRPKLFKNYDQIIAEFANEHRGEYDTIAVELVVNRTKE
jgi:hypothetical protein